MRLLALVTTRPDHKHRDWIAFGLWIFIAVLAAGLPLCFAGKYGLKLKDGSPTEFWHHMENIALGCELAYSLGFFLIYFASRPSLLPVVKWRERCVIIVSLLAGWVLLVWGWQLSVGKHHAVGSGLYLLTLAMILFGLVDYLFGYRAKSDGTVHDVSSFRMAFWFTDIPVILGFAALGAYVHVLTGVSDPVEAPKELQAFVAGSIAFQLFESIIVFGILFWLPLESLLNDKKTGG